MVLDVSMQLFSLGIKMKVVQNVIRMSNSHYVTMSICDIILISLNIATLLVVILSFLKAHTGECRGAVVTKTKTPDGCVTREAKLSMREKGHTNNVNHQNPLNQH